MTSFLVSRLSAGLSALYRRRKLSASPSTNKRAGETFKALAISTKTYNEGRHAPVSIAEIYERDRLKIAQASCSCVKFLSRLKYLTLRPSVLSFEKTLQVDFTSTILRVYRQVSSKTLGFGRVKCRIIYLKTPVQIPKSFVSYA